MNYHFGVRRSAGAWGAGPIPTSTAVSCRWRHGRQPRIDAATGKERWKRQWPTPLMAGVTVTAGGVLFTGDLDDNFVAVDAHTGKTLYTFNTGGSLGGGVIS